MFDKDKIYGALFSGFLSDSIGCPLEFLKDPTKSQIDHALTIGGGGFHKVGKFQISDDSELQLAMMYALYNNRDKDVLFDDISREYSYWIRSDPFDSGFACSTAFSADPKEKKIALSMKKIAKKKNIDSKANGALMRITPLIIYMCGETDHNLVKFVKKDAVLSHPNQTVLDSIGIYAIAMKRLFTGMNNIESYDSAKLWAKKNVNDEVLEWLDLSRDRNFVKNMDVSHLSGFVKWAFILAFHHLYYATPFLDAIRHVISLGNDSDTNACIVGSLIGAYHGYDKLPKNIVKKMITFDPKNDGGHIRPDKYSATHLSKYAKFLHNHLSEK